MEVRGVLNSWETLEMKRCCRRSAALRAVMSKIVKSQPVRRRSRCASERRAERCRTSSRPDSNSNSRAPVPASPERRRSRKSRSGARVNKEWLRTERATDCPEDGSRPMRERPRPKSSSAAAWLLQSTIRPWASSSAMPSRVASKSLCRRRSSECSSTRSRRTSEPRSWASRTSSSKPQRTSNPS